MKIGHGRATHHHVLRLQQSPHNVKNGGFSDGSGLLIRMQRGVARHQVVQSRSWNERGDETNQIVIHVPGVSERVKVDGD